MHTPLKSRIRADQRSMSYSWASVCCITRQWEVRVVGGLKAVFQLPLCKEAAWIHPSGWDNHRILRCGPGEQGSPHGKCRKPPAVSTDFEVCAIGPHNAERLLEAGKGQKRILLGASSQEQRLLGTRTSAGKPCFELRTSRLLCNKYVLFLAIGFYQLSQEQMGANTVILYIWIFYLFINLYVCVCTYMDLCVPTVCRGLNRKTLDPPELKLHTGGCRQPAVGVGNGSWALCKSRKCWSHWAIKPAPRNFFKRFKDWRIEKKTWITYCRWARGITLVPTPLKDK